jgi:(p)ppGpp synthase/HD superfamily hydrolase
MKIEKARTHAIKAHEEINHLYDGKPYSVHLDMAAKNAVKFSYLIPKEDFFDVISGVYEHDTIEDANLTFNDLKKATNEIVAELAYACTNEKGRNRAERANDKYYKGIRNTKYATFVKLCDRIANIEYSTENGSRMIDMYTKEHTHFKKMLYVLGEYEPMWKYIDDILNKKS